VKYTIRATLENSYWDVTLIRSIQAGAVVFLEELPRRSNRFAIVKNL